MKQDEEQQYDQVSEPESSPGVTKNQSNDADDEQEEEVKGQTDPDEVAP